jgi:hypothetical protein
VNQPLIFYHLAITKHSTYNGNHILQKGITRIIRKGNILMHLYFHLTPIRKYIIYLQA